jgi:glucuronate isomerase
VSNNQIQREMRLFSSEPAVREVAAQLYKSVAKLPIISPHGHVDPRLLLENKPFADPAELFVYFDHYVTRLLHANGVPLNEVRVGAEPKQAWRHLASNWIKFAGTASGYWLTHVFESLFEIDYPLSAENADATYDLISAKLTTAEFLPRALFARFGIELLATTDDPIDSLDAHRALAQVPGFEGKVIPTFRPDLYLDPRVPNWSANVEKLIAAAGISGQLSYSKYIEALENRRAFFKQHGAVSTDHGVFEPYTQVLDASYAAKLFDSLFAGSASEAEAREFAGHMLGEMARMSTEDGLVMTIHAGVYRNHSSATHKRFGPDSGHDIPVRAEFTKNLRPLLEAYGAHPNLTVILFSLDETTWGRELAPLAGFYPSVLVGAPWWFLDAPDAAKRFRAAVTDTIGFYRGSGFIDDTRAFLSIPARHDMARRIDCNFLAELVFEGRISLDQAMQIASDLVVAVPRKAFKL